VKLPRKHIPILVKVLVVRRQLRGFGIHVRRRPKQPLSSCFEEWMSHLKSCFNSSTLQLDHDPALGLRKFNPETGTYSPRELDHRYLVYRPDAAHLQKTTGRKPGAERTVTTKGSDVGLMKKFRRLENPKAKKPWPKGRKLRSGNGFGRR
jgi:hypothetical protein